MPDPAAESAFLVDTVADSAVEYEGGTKPMPPGAYIVATVVHTNERCNTFFDELEKFKQDSELIDKVLTAGLAAGSPLAALVGATGLEVAKFTSALALGNQLNQFTADVYAFRAFSDSLKRHVFQGMASYQRAKGIDLYFQRLVGVTKTEILSKKPGAEGTVLSSANLKENESGDLEFELEVGDNPDKKGEKIYRKVTVNSVALGGFVVGSDNPGIYASQLLVARNVGAEYASLCSLATMREIVRNALQGSKTVVEPGPQGSPTTTDTVPKDEASN